MVTRPLPASADAAAWLMNDDNPGVRYLALRDLARLDKADPRLVGARKEAHERGPIAAVLDAMHPDGYWIKPGSGYNPKYRSLVWSLILLAQLGASVEADERVRTACEYAIANNLNPGGQFSSTKGPSGTIDCLQGNLCAALLDLGIDPQRLERAFDWMARTVTGEGVAPSSDKSAPVRYYAYKTGPGFSCGANNLLPCAWGGIKVMMALGKLPSDKRTAVIERAIQAGVDFLFSVDPVTAAYPSGYASQPNRSWWKLGFPVFYISDVLQVVEALSLLGYAKDPRLQNTFDWILAKADPDGRWSLEYSYAGKTWVDFGESKVPNPWVTLRVLKALSDLG